MGSCLPMFFFHLQSSNLYGMVSLLRVGVTLYRCQGLLFLGGRGVLTVPRHDTRGVEGFASHPQLQDRLHDSPAETELWLRVATSHVGLTKIRDP